MFWGPTDQTTNKALWAGTNFCGTHAVGGIVSTNVMLSPAVSQYYYRYYATNADGEVWATNTMPFSTASVLAGSSPTPECG